MKKIKYLLFLAFILYITSFYGCGYTTRAYIGPHQTIYVAPFKNSINTADIKSEYSRYISNFPLLESTITRAVVDRFIFDGSLKITKETDANVVLKGELISYERNALRYAENNEDVTQYRVTLVANIGLYDGKTGKQIWQKDSFAGDSTYHTTGSQTKSEKSALDDAVSDLARRIVEELVEAW
ncbi:MAG: LptE family protein [Candidatus Omnitrophota bacterium]